MNIYLVLRLYLENTTKTKILTSNIRLCYISDGACESGQTGGGANDGIQQI